MGTYIKYVIEERAPNFFSSWVASQLITILENGGCYGVIAPPPLQFVFFSYKIFVTETRL